MITAPTATKITPSVNGYNIETATTVKNGTIGINSFNRFNVGQGDVVNLNLINNQNKLVNLIFDNSPSQINGIVNSYMNNKIGGNVLFANPNGFVVGSTGKFNVGSLTLMTPTRNSMEKLIDNPLFGASSYNEGNVEKLISFSFGQDSYLITGSDNFIELAPSNIDITGTINSAGGIDLISGSPKIS